MRFFATALLAVSAFSAYVNAAPQATSSDAAPSETAPAPTSTPPPPTGGSNPNPISSPTSGTVCKAGEPCTIEWEPTTDGTITLKLRMGDSDNLDTVEVIEEDIPNTGSYTWTPKEDLEGDDTYAIEIVSEDGESNYSPQFTVDSEGTGLSSSSSTESTESTTSTKPTTTVSSVVSTETATTATNNGSSTSTSTTSRPKPTLSDDEGDDEAEDDEDAPNPNDTGAASGLLAMHSPLALILCVGAAMAYLS